MINHLTDSTTPRTAREAFGSDYYPPTPPLVRWWQRFARTIARWL
jgi:hypothetical protein